MWVCSAYEMLVVGEISGSSGTVCISAVVSVNAANLFPVRDCVQGFMDGLYVFVSVELVSELCLLGVFLRRDVRFVVLLAVVVGVQGLSYVRLVLLVVESNVVIVEVLLV